jgi:S-adenosylmethionine decarboxylase
MGGLGAYISPCSGNGAKRRGGSYPSARRFLLSGIPIREVRKTTGVTLERVGARMARLGLRVAAINGVRPVKVRAPARTVPVPIPLRDEDRKDHFITRNGLTYAGSHLIIDLWDAEGLDDRNRIEQALIDAVDAAGATLLHIHLHTFTEGGGISGVAVLSESHISVHTWPERGYAAFDVFMCGDAEPRKALGVFKDAFSPGRIVIGEHKRGVL